MNKTSIIQRQLCSVSLVKILPEFSMFHQAKSMLSFYYHSCAKLNQFHDGWLYANSVLFQYKQKRMCQTKYRYRKTWQTYCAPFCMKPLRSTWFEVAGLLAGRFFQIWTFIGVQNFKITFSFPNTNYFSLLSSTTTFSRALYQEQKKWENLVILLMSFNLFTE